MANSVSSAAPASIKLNDFQRQWSDIGPAVLDAVASVGASGWYILGEEVAAFERDLARFWKRPLAVGVASGLDAIEIGLRCLGCKPGDKVLLPPISAFATVLAVLKLQAIPVFIDCNGCGLANLDLAEEALTADDSIRYFVPVHLYGHCLDMGRLLKLRERFGVRILEDCAQSVGASHHGILSGSAGACAATSFYPTKNLGAMGDGGALLTDSETIAEQARCLRDYGQSSKYCHNQIGYNSRLDELQAAVLRRVLLPRVTAWNQIRRRIAQQYRQGINHPDLSVPEPDPASDSCWHLFPVLVPAPRKAEFRSHLHHCGVLSAEHYPVCLLDQPALASVLFKQVGECPVARELCAREVSLPIHPYLTDAEAERVIEACNRWK